MQSSAGLISDPNEVRDVIVVGGGVTGTAFVKLICGYTNIKSVTLLEKEPEVGEVNSNPWNNAQTSHDGSTETNYNLEHALDVQWKAFLLRHYVDQIGDPTLSQITTRMVLGIGKEEVELLKKRYIEFKPHYPDLYLAGKKKLAVLEPNVMFGRDPKQEIIGLVSNQGYAVNYKRLSEYMLEDAKNSNTDFRVHFNTTVDYKTVRRENGIYILQTNLGEMRARAVVFNAGAYSLSFAHQLGYALNIVQVPMLGSFFSGGHWLNGKVYRVQIVGKANAISHGDKDILNPYDTRYGPTTIFVPLMEAHHFSTFIDYMRTGILTPKGVKCLAKIVFRKDNIGFVIKNMGYELPILGAWSFLPEAQTITPNIRYGHLKRRKGKGGLRPQLLNTDTGELIFGDSLIHSEDMSMISNTTPSPGASSCLGNGDRDVQLLMQYLTEYTYDRERMLADLGVEDRNVQHEILVGAGKSVSATKTT